MHMNSVVILFNGIAGMLIKLRTSKGDYLERALQLWPFFKMGTSLNGKNLLPEGANSFL